nr:phosphorylase-like domain protein [Cedratvirus borely]
MVTSKLNFAFFFLALFLFTLVPAHAGSQSKKSGWGAYKAKVGLVVTLWEELTPYFSLLQLQEVEKSAAWMNYHPFRLYETIHNGVFYRVVWNGLCPYCDPAYGGTAMMTYQGALPATIGLLADGFRPDILVHAGATGGWTEDWPRNSIGVCANGRKIIFAQRNLTDGNPGDLAFGWGDFTCSYIPQNILDRHNVRLSTIATIDTFIPTIEGEAAFDLFGIDQLEMEGAVVASQAALYGLPFIKTAGVANSYVDIENDCPVDQGFQCWNATCWALATATVGILEDFLVPVHHHL